jgi:hypothetical protein
MSTHIEMDDQYSQVTTYNGMLDEKHSFIVEVSYRTSRSLGYSIDSIEFISPEEDESKEYWRTSEDKIKDFIVKWLFEKPKNQGEMEDE